MSVPIEHEPGYGRYANHFNVYAADAATAPTRRSPILASLIDVLTCGQFVPIYVSLLRLPSVQLECRCLSDSAARLPTTKTAAKRYLMPPVCSDTSKLHPSRMAAQLAANDI